MKLIKDYEIYFSRAVSAFCLFLLLAEANVWLNTLDNTILVLGYRLFILTTPFFFLLFNYRLTFVAFVLAIIGLLFWLWHHYLIGTILIALGLAVSGYMLKYYAAFSTKGAARNKIALNIGSILSGVAILLTQNKVLLIFLCIIFLLFSLTSFFLYYKNIATKKLPISKQHFTLKGLFTFRGLAWIIIGYIIGVKLIAIVSILPQFLIQSNHGILPHWYGWMLILNCLIVVVLQLPVMRLIDKWEKLTALIPLIFGMLIVASSPFISITTFWGAFSWTFALSLVECTISYLDKLSQDEHCLLLKESAVGIGSALTVYAIRAFSPETGSLVIGLGSLVLLSISIVLFFMEKQFQLSTKQ